jgi:hypothetical protein
MRLFREYLRAHTKIEDYSCSGYVLEDACSLHLPACVQALLEANWLPTSTSTLQSFPSLDLLNITLKHCLEGDPFPCNFTDLFTKAAKAIPIIRIPDDTNDKFRQKEAALSGNDEFATEALCLILRYSKQNIKPLSFAVTFSHPIIFNLVIEHGQWSDHVGIWAATVTGASLSQAEQVFQAIITRREKEGAKDSFPFHDDSFLALAVTRANVLLGSGVCMEEAVGMIEFLVRIDPSIKSHVLFFRETYMSSLDLLAFFLSAYAPANAIYTVPFLVEFNSTSLSLSVVSALECCVHFGTIDTVKLFLSKGVSVESGIFGPLHLACNRGSIELAVTLIDAGLGKALLFDFSFSVQS